MNLSCRTMTPMDFTGYGIRGNVTDGVLHVEGTTRLSRIALNGENHEAPVAIPLSEIATVKVKRPNPMLAPLLNGRATITTKAGKVYVLHFRRKHLTELDALRGALGV